MIRNMAHKTISDSPRNSFGYPLLNLMVVKPTKYKSFNI